MAVQRKAASSKRGKRNASTRSVRRSAAHGRWDDVFDFRPSAWFTTLIGSQTGRAIMAEVLVAAAGAAAAVLMAARTEPRSGDGRAAAKGRDMTALMKEAARSAASAAGAVLSGRALEAVGNAARSALKDQNQRSASTDFSDRTRDRDQAS